MILKRFYDARLAQASYLIGCGATGDALIVDPNRDLRQYREAAREERLRITAVTETHIHADYVSGSRELAADTGARLYLSDEGGREWRYAFAAESGAVLLRDGDRFMVGNVRVDVRHTPGHTPEHLTFLVTDTAGADRPIGALTGDFVFVGDVGRPDLLERAARYEGTMEEAARTLHRSLRRFVAEQPEWLQIWPGHGAGSACGKGLSSIPHSTLGYERLFNWGLGIEDEDTFVRSVLEGQPEPPTYFARMKRVNREGPALLGGFEPPDRLDGETLERRITGGALVLDTRRVPEFAARHLPGTINIPLDRSFNTWAGWLVPDEVEPILIVGEGDVTEAVRDLAMVGIDRVAGYVPPSVIDEAAAPNAGLRKTRRIGTEELARLIERSEATVVDVRGRGEWDAGHIPGAIHIPLGHLEARIDELSGGRPVVVHCQGGARSPIAASLLEARGIGAVHDLPAGFAGWEAEGRPIARDHEMATT